ncbi:CsgE family curli-type amyloid fiber assembly protein [Spirosoma pulveris]
MKRLKEILLLCLTLVSFAGWAQDPDLEGKLEEGTMDEAVITEEGTETLLLDNTRSKIGRDFYEAFFRHYAELPKTIAPIFPADTTLKITPNVELDINAFVVTIDELPALGAGTSIISVSLNDQMVWQNYVQIRQEVLELYAFNAAEVINQYVLNYQEVQRSLENDDQKGTGIF